MGSPLSRIAAIRQAAISKAPRCLSSSGMRGIIGEEKANIKQDVSDPSMSLAAQGAQQQILLSGVTLQSRLLLRLKLSRSEFNLHL